MNPAALKALVLSALLSLAVLAGYVVRNNSARAETADLRAEFAKAQRAQADRHAEALKHAIALERAAIAKLQEAQDAEIQRREAADLARRRADAAARSLRDELQATREQLAALKNDPSTSPGCKAAAEAGAMCAILLGRCNDRRAELADFAERSANAGQLCVDAYQALMPAIYDGPPSP